MKSCTLKSCPTKICKLFIKAFKVALTMYTLICHLLDYLLKINIQTFELPLCVKHASVILGGMTVTASHLLFGKNDIPRR